jgi:hypothetical protein
MYTPSCNTAEAQRRARAAALSPAPIPFAAGENGHGGGNLGRIYRSGRPSVCSLAPLLWRSRGGCLSSPYGQPASGRSRSGCTLTLTNLRTRKSALVPPWWRARPACATSPKDEGEIMSRTIKLNRVSDDGRRVAAGAFQATSESDLHLKWELHLATAAQGLYVATHRGVQLGIGIVSDTVRHQGGRHG